MVGENPKLRTTPYKGCGKTLPGTLTQLELNFHGCRIGDVGAQAVAAALPVTAAAAC